VPAPAPTWLEEAFFPSEGKERGSTVLSVRNIFLVRDDKRGFTPLGARVCRVCSACTRDRGRHFSSVKEDCSRHESLALFQAWTDVRCTVARFGCRWLR